MHIITLPKQLKSSAFIKFLGDLSKAREATEIAIDFQYLQMASPAPLAALTATIQRWMIHNKKVFIRNFSLCPIGPYLQRMDFLKACGVEEEENFVRRHGEERFVPLLLIDHPVDRIATQLADCLAPGGCDFEHELAHLWDFAYYVISEMGNNVRQHSLGVGYAAAQFTAKDNMIRLAIADSGNGILRSFQDAGFASSETMSHEEAVKLALRPRVTSKGTPNNEGVGLTLVSKLTELTGGWLAVLSGNGVASAKKGGVADVASIDEHYQGTIVAFAFDLSKINNYPHLLEQAKLDVGLLKREKISISFE